MTRTIKIFVLFISLFCSGILLSDAATLTAQQQQQIISRINTAASEIKTMTCSFTQTKNLSILNDKMVSHGKMLYSQPDKLRWEYTNPYQYLFIFNGSKIYIGNKSRKDVIDTNSNKVFKEVARIMMSTVTGKALSSTSEFTISVADERGAYVVTMLPKKKEIRQMFSRIELVFDKTGSMISEINIFEKNGDSTNIKITNISTNKAVDESNFAIPE